MAAVSGRPASIESPRSPMKLRPRAWATPGCSRTGYTILGFAALVFIAACANLGNMLYARAMEREGEMATRLALGATQFHVFRALFNETLWICAAASLAGIAMAAGALELFADAVPAFHTNYWRSVRLDLSLDLRVFGYAAGAGALAALVVGAGSLWRSNRSSLLTRLAASGTAVVAKTEGRTLRTMLVAVQVSAAVLLLIATGMLLESTSRQLDRRILFDTGLARDRAHRAARRIRRIPRHALLQSAPRTGARNRRRVGGRPGGCPARRRDSSAPSRTGRNHRRGTTRRAQRYADRGSTVTGFTHRLNCWTCSGCHSCTAAASNTRMWQGPALLRSSRLPRRGGCGLDKTPSGSGSRAAASRTSAPSSA